MNADTREIKGGATLTGEIKGGASADTDRLRALTLTGHFPLRFGVPPSLGMWRTNEPACGASGEMVALRFFKVVCTGNAYM